MKTKLIATLLMAGGALLAAPRVSIGVQIGAPAPVVVSAYRPPCPGPGYVWIDGYYDAYGNWFDGYWAVPPYAGAYWIAPRYERGRFIAGYWGGERRDFDRGYRDRDHDWDRGWDHDRGRRWDHDRDRGWDHDRDRDFHR